MKRAFWLACCEVALSGFLSDPAIAQRANFNRYEGAQAPAEQQPARPGPAEERPLLEPTPARVDNPFGDLGPGPRPTRQQPAIGGQPLIATPELPEPEGVKVELKEPACHCAGDGPAAERIGQTLRGPLSSDGIEYANQPLDQVVNEIAQKYGLPIQIDTVALNDQGLNVDEPVTISIRGISLRSALELLLKRLSLTSIVVNEVLMITTPQVAEEHLKICVYDVRDLVGPSGRAAPALIDAVQAAVAPETWAKNGGGTGDIKALPWGVLLISQTEAVHDEIRGLLTALRKTLAQQGGAAAAEIHQPLVTRHYVLQIGRPADEQAFQKQLRDLIIQLLPDQTIGGTTPDGEPVLSVLPDRVVVRHNESVQQQVEQVLRDLGLTTQQPIGASTPAGMGGGFGGGGFGGGAGFGGGGFFQPQPAGR
jgi:hypothetical protein